MIGDLVMEDEVIDGDGVAGVSRRRSRTGSVLKSRKVTHLNETRPRAKNSLVGKV